MIAAFKVRMFLKQIENFFRNDVILATILTFYFIGF